MNALKHIPNLLTLTNLFLGCLALLYIFFGQMYMASYMVMMAAVIDFFDGFVAKLLNAQTELGKQLDSLADLVTFGVVPGMMMYYLLASAYNAYPFAMDLPIIYFVPGFSITLFSAFRLAKFNIDHSQKEAFIGLPTPACALLIVSLPFMNYFKNFGMDIVLTNEFILYIIIIGLSYLLVSPLKMFSLKFKNYSLVKNKIRYFFILMSLIFIVSFQFFGLTLSIVLYLILSVLNNFTKHEIQS